MKKYLLWFFLLIKRQIKKPALWLLLIGMPLAAGIIVNIPAVVNDKGMKVGIIVKDDDEIVSKAVDELCNGNYQISFYIEESEEKLAQDILNNDTSCGYIFSENMKQKLDMQKYDQSITVLKSSADFVSEMTNEIVFASLFKAYGGNIAKNCLESSNVFNEYTAEAIQKALDSYSRYANGEKTFHLNFENTYSINSEYEKSTDNNKKELEEQSNLIVDEENSAYTHDTGLVKFPVRGIMAVFVMAAGLSGCIWWKKDEKNGLFKSMTNIKKYAGSALYVYTLTLLSSISALVVIGVTHTNIQSFYYEIAKMVVYTIFICIVGVCVCAVVSDISAMISFILVYVIISLIVCPIFIDLSQVIPVVKYISRCVLPYYFI